MKESDSFLEAQVRRKRGSRGQSSQDLVQEFLTEQKSKDQNFDFDRLYDTKSAGRILPAQVSDFTFCYKGRAGAIEVKETKHDYRISNSDFPQEPRLRRRALAGALAILVVHHTTSGVWRLVQITAFSSPMEKSLDLSGVPTHSTFKAVLWSAITC